MTDFESFNFKGRITGRTPTGCTLKRCNFWTTLEMPLIDREINVILTSSANCVITNSGGAGTFTITDTHLYVSVVTFSTEDNSKLLQPLISVFKRSI